MPECTETIEKTQLIKRNKKMMHGSRNIIAEHTAISIVPYRYHEKLRVKGKLNRVELYIDYNVKQDPTLLPVDILAVLSIGSIELFSHLKMFSFNCLSPPDAFL
jgi:hypothetical protein